MNIKDIIDKLNKGEKLTDEELGLLGKALTPDEADAKAAAARRKAEDEAKALKDKIAALEAEKAASDKAQRKKEEEGQTATQKMEKQLADLTKKFTALEAAKAASDKAAADMLRAQTIDQIRAKAGIKFRSGIDPAITTAAFAKAFEGVEDLADAARVEEAVKAFRDANTGLIEAEGHGSGLKSSPITQWGGENPYSTKTLNLTRQIEIEKSDPSKAAELKAAAIKE